jgi:hypothetical protein
MAAMMSSVTSSLMFVLFISQRHSEKVLKSRLGLSSKRFCITAEPYHLNFATEVPILRHVLSGNCVLTFHAGWMGGLPPLPLRRPRQQPKPQRHEEQGRENSQQEAHRHPAIRRRWQPQILRPRQRDKAADTIAGLSIHRAILNGRAQRARPCARVWESNELVSDAAELPLLAGAGLFVVCPDTGVVIAEQGSAAAGLVCRGITAHMATMILWGGLRTALPLP